MPKTDKQRSVAQPSRRAFLTGAVRRLRGEQWAPGIPGPVALESWVAEEESGPEVPLPLLRERVKADPGDAASRTQLGLALFKRGNLIQARVEFERALRLGEEDPETLLHLGLVLARTDRADKTASVWKRYLATNAEPARPEIETLLARLVSDAPPTAAEMAEIVERSLGMAVPDFTATL